MCAEDGLAEDYTGPWVSVLPAWGAWGEQRELGLGPHCLTGGKKRQEVCVCRRVYREQSDVALAGDSSGLGEFKGEAK